MVTTRRQQNSEGTAPSVGTQPKRDTKPESGTKRKQAQTTSSTKPDTDHEAKPTNDRASTDAEPASKKSKPDDGARSAAAAAAAGPDAKVVEDQAATLETHTDALSWLHSDEAWTLAYPSIPSGTGEVDLAADDADAGNARPAPRAGAGHNRRADADDGRTLRFPSSELTPVQSLVAALLLSRPISHRLGIRAIETALNAPFWFRTVADLDAAGEEGRREALWHARTQHKEKTAAQLGSLVDGLRRLCRGDEAQVDTMEPVRRKAVDSAGGGGAEPEPEPEAVADEVRRMLTAEVNGLGPTGCDIFLRRVQTQWKEVFPFADRRCLEVGVQLGVVEAADLDERRGGSRRKATEALARTVAEHVGFPFEEARTEGEESECGRWWFARTLDVLIGLAVEKKVERAREVLGLAEGGEGGKEQGEAQEEK